MKQSLLDTLQALAELTDKNGFPPSRREMAAKLGITINAVKYRLESLMNDGLVVMDPDGRRTAKRSDVITKAGRELVCKYRTVKIIEHMTPEMADAIGFKATINTRKGIK